MATHSEEPVAERTMSLLQNSGKEAARIIGVSPDDEPVKIILAVDAFVFAWQNGKAPPRKVLSPEDAPYSIGPLWGQQLVRRFGWEWRQVTFHEHNDTKAPGVLSPDRALAVYPMHFLMGCLKNPGVDATIALSFDMLEAGKIDVGKPGEYFNLMEGVHRIVPRTWNEPPKGLFGKLFGRGKG